MGTNEDDKEKYDLYTEQVVLHPAKKYKWLIRIGKLLLFAVSVVIAATLFMVFLYPVLQKRIEEKNKDKNVIYIQKDNYILAENQTAEYSDILTEKDLKDNYEAAMAALRAKVEDVNKCVVLLTLNSHFLMFRQLKAVRQRWQDLWLPMLIQHILCLQVQAF